MSFRQSNLSFFRKWMLLSCVLQCQLLSGQQSNHPVIVKDRKIDNSHRLPPAKDLYKYPKKIGIQNSRTASPITITYITTPSSCGYGNGSVIITASGGTAPYQYSTSLGWTQNTGNFPNLGTGTYTFTVTDATNQSESVIVTVTSAIQGPSINVISHTNVSNCTSGDGTVTVQATGGTTPYEYSIDMVNFQSSNVFTNVSSGLYFFYVRDANGCIAHTDNVAFFSMGCNTMPGIPFGYTPSCGNNGTISFYILPNTGPYTFSFDGGPFSTTSSWSNLSPGMHSILIKDVNNQVFLVSLPVPLLCMINISYVAVDAACGQGDGSLTITASGGITPYTYTIDGINYQSSNVFSGLAPGNYFVTAKDANGVTNSRLCNVFDQCPVVTLTSTDETCQLNDGTVTATATRGTVPYEYSIDGVSFQSSNIFIGLAAGSYTVTLRDALGFTTTATTTINYYCLAVTTIHTNVVCGNMNGTITATGSGGTAPYQYSLDGINFQSNNIFTGLGAGTYTVTIKDATGQTATTSVVITDSPGPIVTVTSTPTSCTNNDGTLTITPIGGTPPYTYTLDNINYQTSNVFTNLGVNNYFASARDANGCQWGITQWVEWDCPTITTNVTSETCGNANGTISVTVANATPPFQYSLDGINFQTSPVFTGLVAGSYTITVRSALNHTNTATATITNTCPVVSATASDGTCGNANGSINATGSNGIPPYQYSLDGINFQANNVFNNLTSGFYTITIKDASGATNTTTVTLGNIPGPQIITISSPASCTNNDGIITVTGNGGTLPFQFSIDGINFQVNNVFGNLASGSYTAWVKDANGCLISQSMVIAVDTNLTLNTGSVSPVCESKTVTLPAQSNGTNFTWSPASGLNDIHLLNPVSSTLLTTIYYITASLGVCTKVDSIRVFVNAAPIPFAGTDSTICYGQSIQLNGTGGLTYEWTPATYLDNPHISNPTAISLPASIIYNLKVTDVNGCESLQGASIKVTVTPMPKVFAGNDTSIIMNKPFVLTAIDINNSGFVQYNWSPPYGLNNSAIQNPATTLDKNISYMVTAVTGQGCIGTDNITIQVYKGPEIYVPSAFSPNNDGRNDVLKAIAVGIREFKYFVVYNRWGQRIFYSRDPSNGWDGRNKGLSIDAGTYVWMAEGIDDQGKVISRKGTVTLIR